MVEVQGLKGTSLTAALLDLERLVYISSASLRLTKVYVNEVYPKQGHCSIVFTIMIAVGFKLNNGHVRSVTLQVLVGINIRL